MAFGKKKGDEAGQPPVEAEAEDDGLSLFPEAGSDDLAAADAPAPVGPDGPPPAEVQPPAPEPASAGDALLSVFQSSDSSESDRSVLLDLAGDVELADLLEDLNTLAAAIGVVRG
jgi:hypothetical protein